MKIMSRLVIETIECAGFGAMLKTLKLPYGQECKSLSGEELEAAKDNINEGLRQTRTYMFSYQALRRIYFQRKNHRLPIWSEFCEWIKALPLAEELIIIE